MSTLSVVNNSVVVVPNVLLIIDKGAFAVDTCG
jgi:hypothetical protein